MLIEVLLRFFEISSDYLCVLQNRGYGFQVFFVTDCWILITAEGHIKFIVSVHTIQAVIAGLVKENKFRRGAVGIKFRTNVIIEVFA